jgi:actin-related protein 10
MIICESPLLPQYVKDLLSDLLFKKFQCQAVSFLPSPVLSLMTLGKQTGLVVDMGYLETVITPVRIRKTIIIKVLIFA